MKGKYWLSGFSLDQFQHNLYNIKFLVIFASVSKFGKHVKCYTCFERLIQNHLELSGFSVVCCTWNITAIFLLIGTPEGKSKPKQKRAKTQRDSGIDEATGSSSSSSGPRPSLSSEYNPLYSFSSEELKNMDKEVEDIFGDESSSSDESDTEATSNQESLGSITQMISSSSEESLTGENPRGWSPKRRMAESDSDHDSGDSTSSPGISEGGRSSGDEDMMAEAIDDLLSYSKVPTVSERLNLQRQ